MALPSGRGWSLSRNESFSPLSQSVSCRHPAASHGLVDVDDCRESSRAGLRGTELGGEKLLLCVEDRQVGGVATIVLKPGEARVFLERDHLLPLGGELLFEFLAGDEGVVDVGEGVLDGLQISVESSLPACLGLLDLAPDTSAGEDGSGQGTCVIPCEAASIEKVVPVGA